ncbi:MAG: PD-(D/E)XK nuclease family protein [Anaerolineaceae bacterium]|nr:MAG: PD-(D/E)XK nuclease family protein [Anaerolineaceae bacterium]
MQLPTPFAFSQSSLQDYFDCPRRFELRYIEKLDWPAEEAEPALENERRMADGNFFHRLAQQFLLGLPADKLSRLASSPDASTGLSTSLSRWWENFEKDFGSLREFRNLHPEIVLSAPIGNHRLLAKYDLIAVAFDKATIYDWKTYHKRPKNEWMAARMQTRVYRYLLASAGNHLNGGKSFSPESIEMIYWFAEFPSEPAAFHYDAATFQRDASAFEILVHEITSREKFELTEDEGKCRFCPYRSYCKRGAIAGDWREAELEAEVHEAFDINFEQIGEIAF